MRMDWWDYPWSGVGLEVSIGCATTCMDSSSRLVLILRTEVVELAKSMHFGLFGEKLSAGIDSLVSSLLHDLSA